MLEKIRAIGISNMTMSKLQAVLLHLKVMPAAMEMELHPAFQQKALLRFALNHGIRPIGFCPLGSPSRPERDKTSQDVAAMEMPVIQKIAWAHGIHPSGVRLKWASQMGAVPIPFSVKQPQYHKTVLLREDRFFFGAPAGRASNRAIKPSMLYCPLFQGGCFLLLPDKSLTNLPGWVFYCPEWLPGGGRKSVSADTPVGKCHGHS